MRALRRRRSRRGSCSAFQLKHGRELADTERLPTILFAGGRPCRKLRLVRPQVRQNSFRDRASRLRAVRLAPSVLELQRQPACAKVKEKREKVEGRRKPASYTITVSSLNFSA